MKIFNKNNKEIYAQLSVYKINKINFKNVKNKVSVELLEKLNNYHFDLNESYALDSKWKYRTELNKKVIDDNIIKKQGI